MYKYLSTMYKNSYKKVVDSTTDIRPNLQYTKSPHPLYLHYIVFDKSNRTHPPPLNVK